MHGIAEVVVGNVAEAYTDCGPFVSKPGSSLACSALAAWISGSCVDAIDVIASHAYSTRATGIFRHYLLPGSLTRRLLQGNKSSTNDCLARSLSGCCKPTV